LDHQLSVIEVKMNHAMRQVLVAVGGAVCGAFVGAVMGMAVGITCGLLAQVAYPNDLSAGSAAEIVFLTLPLGFIGGAMAGVPMALKRFGKSPMENGTA
jgi:hypothetical protein